MFAGAAVVLPRRVSEVPPDAATAEPTPPPVRETPAPRPPEPTDQEMLQGTWVVVKAALDGEPYPDPVFAETRFVFAGDRFTYRNKKTTLEGTFHLDATRSPKALDVVQGKDVFMTCIFERTGTRLEVCWRKGGPRPKGFDTAKERDTVLYVLEKQ
jgi:uncharacterized protein (TIGR03067 family)